MEDLLYNMLSLYKKLPYPLKLGIGYLYRLLPNSIKYGRFYFEYVERLKNFNSEIQQNLLKSQLKFSYQNIPYYKKVMFTRIEDFPIVNKNIIRENKSKFVNPSNFNRLVANTGGSSGTPFEFYLEKGVSRPKEKAHFDWYWGQFGYKPGNKILMIRGEPLADNKLWEYQVIENKLAISCYLINSTNVTEVYKVIKKFEPSFIHAYPSALKNFISCLDKANIQSNLNIKAIFLGSEGLYLTDQLQIEDYFKAKVAHWYGHSERLIHAGNCPYSSDLHIYPSYGYAELLNENMEIITEPNIKGEIVATGFDNQIMPMIRYATGDEAEYSEKKECECGFKGSSFKNIYGRKQDYIYLSDGTKVSLTAFIFGQHFDEFNSIKELQIVQEKMGDILIKIVLQSDNSLDENNFIRKLIDSVNNKITISLQLEDEIPKTKRGKHIFLIQKINNHTADETSNTKF
ncbi:hypothetical protein [Galbibacter sp.]|uniref:hypothetical protein n=1 Tax=Galbibacter sp. TaxID=2918471 RepID=UPI003A941B27